MFSHKSSCKLIIGFFVSLLILDASEGISDAYQESILLPYRIYSDVAIFHYYVPTQVTRATWEFAAFMDDAKCTEREVHICLQPGSFPIVNPDNSTFPDKMYIEDDQQFMLMTVTKYQPHDALVFRAFNPVPGNWFAVAYISDWVHKIRQQGISHKCKYSLGSIASWIQTNDVTLLIPSVPLPFTTSTEYSYFKFYIPEHIWSFQLIVHNCTFQSTAESSSDSCIHGLGIQARALPFPSPFNATDDNMYVINQPQPEQLTYYYLIVTTSTAATYTIVLQIEECVNLLSPIHSFSLDNLSSAMSTNRHTNQSVREDWEAIVLSTNDLHTTEPDGYNKYKECFPVIPLVRIKHAPDFTNTFLIQGIDWYTPWLVVSSKSPVIVKLELLPFLDIGGTLKFGLRLLNDSLSYTDEVTVISACVNRGSPPQVEANHVLCKQDLRVNVSSLSHEEEENKLYFSFPQPGFWFFSFEMFCYNKTAQGTLIPSPCSNQRSSIYLDIRVQPCIYDNNHCGELKGVCHETHRGQFFFSSCQCYEGWRGWGCTDGSHSSSSEILLMKTLYLTLSNLFFVPAIGLAVKRKFYTEAVVYTFTMVFSALYHACDEQEFGYCIIKFEVLQFCDFYSAILSFWVTLVAMANLPWKMSSVLHMVGALTIALGVEYQRTGLWVFVAPLSIGVLLLKISWMYHCQQTKSCYPLQRWWLTHFFPGVLLVCTGLFLFAFVETEANYEYIHSLWHILIALSIVFFLPVGTEQSKDVPSAGVSQTSEFIDVNDYSLSTDFERLVRATS